MNFSGLVRWGIVVALITSNVAGQGGPCESNAPSPLDLLTQAYSASSHFAPEDRAAILLTAVHRAQPLSKEYARRWSTELFWLAKQTTGDDRAAMEKNAIVELSAIDPEMAAELFMQQDTPVMVDGSEDTRPYAAEVLFPALWSGSGVRSIQTITHLADWTGSTGQYPYLAMSDIIARVSRKEPRLAQELYLSAVQAFRQDAGFASTNSLFVDFILKTRMVPTADLLGTAVASAVSKLQESDTDKGAEGGKTGPVFRIEIEINQRTLTFASQSEALLFRLLPLIKHVNPNLARSILDKRDKLRSYGDVPQDAEYTIHAVRADTSDAPSGTAIQEALDRSRLREIIELAKTNPDAAASNVNRLSSPSVRDLALASILPQVTDANLKEAASIISELESKLKSMKPSAVKLRLEVRLATAYLQLRRTADARMAVTRAFDLGQELFAQDRLAHPGAKVYTVIGFDDLIELTETIASKGAEPWNFLQSIRLVSDEVLRSELLVFFAGGLVESQANQRRPLKVRDEGAPCPDPTKY